MDATPTYGGLVFRERSGKTDVLLLYHKPEKGYGGSYALPACRAQDDNPKTSVAETIEASSGLTVKPEWLVPLREQYETSLRTNDGAVQQFILQVFVAERFEGQLAEDGSTIPEWIKADSDRIEELPGKLPAIIRDGLEAYHQT